MERKPQQEGRNVVMDGFLLYLTRQVWGISHRGRSRNSTGKKGKIEDSHTIRWVERG